MLRVLLARFKQKYRTVGFPKKEPTLPDKFMGRPVLDTAKCISCQECAKVCPVDCITFADKQVKLDLGKCLFCNACTKPCTPGAITFSKDYSLAVSKREDLVITAETKKLAAAVDKKIHRMFGRSLKLRQVSAAGCNACEADLNVLSTIVFDLPRFGIQFVASPRHADGIVVTGPVSKNMEYALKQSYDATPTPKIVIAVGSCAINGGPYLDHPEACNGADKVLPVDLYIPGCPPHPVTILDGFLQLIGRIKR